MKPFFFFFFLFLFRLSSIAQLPVFKATVYDSSAKGYYFLADGKEMMIMDANGSLVFYKQGKPCYHFLLQHNDMMSYSDLHQFYLMDSTFKVVDSVKCKNKYAIDPHDFWILPDGHLLLLGEERIRTDVSCHHVGFSDTATIRYALIQELDVNRTVIFEWHARDYINFEDADTSLFVSGNYQDFMHANAVEQDNDGNILLSSRNLNEITKINRTDGSVMWRWGGKRNQFKFVNCPVPFYGQHDIRRIANGHVTLFDNGMNTIAHGARAMEFELDEKNKIATLKWCYTYDSTKYSSGRGNVQRLNNSQTLINFGSLANDSVCFVVVDSAGSKIIQVDNLHSNRVLYYPSLPWRLQRPLISCFDSLGVAYLKTKENYASYRWSDSSTTRIIRVAKRGIYFVFVPYGEEGYISSEKFIVTDSSKPCNLKPVKRNAKGRKNKDE